jgi:hypothetical protein
MMCFDAVKYRVPYKPKSRGTARTVLRCTFLSSQGHELFGDCESECSSYDEVRLSINDVECNVV